MSARDVALRLGLTRHPRDWRGNCPRCGYPRSFAVREERGRTRLFCANGCTGGELQDAVGRLAGGTWTPPTPLPSADAAAVTARKQEAALRLLRGAGAVSGTAGERYLVSRGLAELADSPALRFRLDTPHPQGSRLPAIIAAVAGLGGSIVAVHRTYVRRDGSGKADIEPQRASLGPVWGGAVRLRPAIAGQALVIGEGIESSASAGLMMGLPAWAALSAGNLARGLELPLELRHVVIAVDPDAVGEGAARAAAARWRAEGRRVDLARPTGGGDFNDVLQASLTAAARCMAEGAVAQGPVHG